MLKLAHIALSVSDLQNSISFYEKNFGFKCDDILEDKTLKFKIALLKRDSIILEFFQFQEFNPLPEYRKDIGSDIKTLGVKHFAFEVNNIEETYKRLNKSGVNFASRIQSLDSGMKYFFVRDPDGILVEITQEEE